MAGGEGMSIDSHAEHGSFQDRPFPAAHCKSDLTIANGQLSRQPAQGGAGFLSNQ
jgi:hypothetical protein